MSLDREVDKALIKAHKTASVYIQCEEIEAILTEVISAKFGFPVRIEIDTPCCAFVEVPVSIEEVKKLIKNGLDTKVQDGD